MQLTKDQKQDLQSLLQHRGFTILEDLVEEMEKDLFSKFKTVKLGDEDIAIKLNAAQNQLAGAEYLMSVIKAKAEEIKEKVL